MLVSHQPLVVVIIKTGNTRLWVGHLLHPFLLGVNSSIGDYVIQM